MSTARNTFTVRPYQDEDAGTVRHIFAQTHLAEAELIPEHLRLEYRIAIAGEVGSKLANIRETYATGHNQFFIASNADEPAEIAGFCGLYHIDDETCELKNVAILPTYQGQGISRLLLDAFDAAARNAGYRRAVLFTYSNLRVATQIYRRRGWTEIPVEITPDMISELEPIAMEFPLQ